MNSLNSFIYFVFYLRNHSLFGDIFYRNNKYHKSYLSDDDLKVRFFFKFELNKL